MQLLPKQGPDDHSEDHAGPSSADDARNGTGERNRAEVYTRRVQAGRRTYFFDVKATLSGEDFFITITESKRLGDNRYEKHKIFLYKEDFGKFIDAITDVVQHVKVECLADLELDETPVDGGTTPAVR